MLTLLQLQTTPRNSPPFPLLLRQLADADSDVVVPQLWNVWCSEKGMDAKREIKQCGSWINSGDPDLLERANDRVKVLSEKFPNWAEPYNRMATIQFRLENYEAAQDIYKKALDLKPWHLGALNGMLMCHHVRGDQDGTKSWARQALPPAGRFRDPRRFDASSQSGSPSFLSAAFSAATALAFFAAEHPSHHHFAGIWSGLMQAHLAW